MLPSAESLEGKPVSQATFEARPDDRWRDVVGDAVSKGKTVVALAVPGAYTPTCSSSHPTRRHGLAPLLCRVMDGTNAVEMHVGAAGVPA